MSASTAANQIIFHYQSMDSAPGLTRETTKRMAECLGVDEAQVIHRALRQLATQVLPQYEADDQSLTATQINQIRRRAPQATKRSVRSSLVDIKSA